MSLAPTIEISTEQEVDFPKIKRLLDLAFGGTQESELVQSLRQCSAYISDLSLVLEVDGQLIGHILFSKADIVQDANRTPTLGLAPMSVHPSWQRKGWGKKLIIHALKKAKKLGHGSVVVLGHHTYYPRFGFQPASKFGIYSEWQVPDENFMVLELHKGALVGVRGTVKFATPFSVF